MRVATYSVYPVGSANAGQYSGGGFMNASGVLTDPTTVTLTLRDGAGVTTTPSAVKDGTGLYHFDVDTTGKPGTWAYKWTGSGGIQAIGWKFFRVTQPPL